jgi:hypothetical protein
MPEIVSIRLMMRPAAMMVCSAVEQNLVMLFWVVSPVAIPA